MKDNAKTRIKNLSCRISSKTQPSTFRSYKPAERQIKAIRDKSGLGFSYIIGGNETNKGHVYSAIAVLNLSKKEIHKLVDLIFGLELEEGIMAVEMSVTKECVRRF